MKSSEAYDDVITEIDPKKSIFNLIVEVCLWLGLGLTFYNAIMVFSMIKITKVPFINEYIVTISDSHLKTLLDEESLKSLSWALSHHMLGISLLLIGIVVKLIDATLGLFVKLLILILKIIKFAARVLGFRKDKGDK